LLEVMLIQPVHCLLHFEGAKCRALGRVRHRRRCTEKHQDGVPDNLIDGPATFLYQLDHGREVMVQQGNNVGGLKSLGKGGEATKIGHQKRNLAFLSTELKPVGCVKECFHYFGASVTAKGLANELVATIQLLVQVGELLVGVLQLLGHAVEGNREIPHEVHFMTEV